MADLYSQTSPFLFPSCPKLRILIIGPKGTGKTTLASKLLGPNSGGRNPHLIVNDFEEFEGDSRNLMEQVGNLIGFRKEKRELRERLHCIWYCVSCVDGESTRDGVEGKFFGLDTGDIPVFVVFTKFDALIKKHAEKLGEDDATLTDQTAEEAAFEDYRDNIESRIVKSARGNPMVKICRVALPETKSGHEEYKLAEYGTGELVGLNSLIKEVAKDLKANTSAENKHGKLQDVWIAGQCYNSDEKLKSSLQACIADLWNPQEIFGTPTTPVTSLSSLSSAYNHILQTQVKYWNLKASPQDLLTSESNSRVDFIETIYDAPLETLNMNSYLLASYGLEHPQVAKTVLKLITGLSLIFERLFWLQMKEGELTRELVRGEVKKWKFGREIELVNRAIEEGIGMENFGNIEFVRSVAENAVREGKKRDGEKDVKGEEGV